jgi:hypothetical protein
MLKAVKAGNKVKFDPDQVNGQLTVTTIERTRRGRRMIAIRQACCGFALFRRFP